MIALVGAYFSVQELSVYLRRNPNTAAADAEAYFVRICDYERLNPSEFVGPTQDNPDEDEKLRIYRLSWKRSIDEIVAMTASYLPYEINYPISPGITDRKLDRCIAQAGEQSLAEEERQRRIGNCVGVKHRP
jgi:hypothetical protein